MVTVQQRLVLSQKSALWYTEEECSCEGTKQILNSYKKYTKVKVSRIYLFC